MAFFSRRALDIQTASQPNITAPRREPPLAHWVNDRLFFRQALLNAAATFAGRPICAATVRVPIVPTTCCCDRSARPDVVDELRHRCCRNSLARLWRIQQTSCVKSRSSCRNQCSRGTPKPILSLADSGRSRSPNASSRIRSPRRAAASSIGHRGRPIRPGGNREMAARHSRPLAIEAISTLVNRSQGR